MATKFTLASPANFAGNSLLTEFPVIPNLGWATFIGDKSLNAQDGTNLAGTGAFTNVGSGPVLHPNYGSFTCLTNGLQTPAPHQISYTRLHVTRFNLAFSIIDGVDDGANPTQLQWTGSGMQSGGVAGESGMAITGTFPGLWICVAITTGPAGSYGMLYDLSHGTASQSGQVWGAGARRNANWQIGSRQTLPAGYTNPNDIAFSMGVPSVVPLATLQQAYVALKGMLAPRGIAVV